MAPDSANGAELHAARLAALHPTAPLVVADSRQVPHAAARMTGHVAAVGRVRVLSWLLAEPHQGTTGGRGSGSGSGGGGGGGGCCSVCAPSTAHLGKLVKPSVSL